MKIFESENITAKGRLLPFREFKPFRDLPEQTLSEETKAALIENGVIRLHFGFGMLKASDYMRFYRDGNRSVYEEIYFSRRNIVIGFLLAEICERKGRFTDMLVDGIWHILEETTWVVPAHLKNTENEVFALPPEYENDVEMIDLFSACTAAVLAWAYYLGKPFLDEVSPSICNRIIFELNRRIFKPYMQNDKLWWTGFGGRRVNNWNPWIISNVLTAAALCIKMDKARCEIVDRSLVMLDNFTDGYLPDGGCDEGPGYWAAAGASYFDALEIIYDMTGGGIDVFHVPLLRNMGEYIMNVHINGDYFIPFADAHPRLKVEYAMVARFGRRTGSNPLASFGVKGWVKNGQCPVTCFHSYRGIKNLYDIPRGRSGYRTPKSVWLDGICVMAQRSFSETDQGLFLAAKGGNNAEQHNHNDVGNFIVYADGEPLIIDAGVGTYRRETFDSSARYKIWTMQSAYHNLPVINGMMQAQGRSFEVKNITYTKNSRKLIMDLTAAYPGESKLKSYVRAVKFGKDEIEIEDKLSLNSTGEIIFNIMFCDKPELAGNGMVVLRAGHTLAFDPSLSAVVETVTLDDAGLKNDWEREKLFRLRLTAHGVETCRCLIKVK